MQRNKNLTRRISPAREVAFSVLQAVDGGAYASDALRELAADLDSRDAGLASEIVFGALRYRGQLDCLIHQYSGRDANSVDGAVRTVLRMAIYQMRYLDRVPPHAAVDEAVELTKRAKRAASGLVNAVLRKVNRAPVTWPDEATEFSCPAWLLERWKRHFGIDSARAIASAALETPVNYVRIAEGTTAPGSMQLERTGVPRAFRVLSPIPPGIRMHDIGSQAIVPLLELSEGLSMLDLCAAPGNKTLQAAETSLRLLVACDISSKRLREVPDITTRVVLDASRPLPFRRVFDRVFVDAPCSGTGTIGRNPEIKWRVHEDDFARFQAIQKAILREGLAALKPGGKLVYATCSLEREENEEVVQAFLREHGDLRCEAELWRLPGRDEGDGFYAARFGLAG